jgi:hypothetical protein
MGRFEHLGLGGKFTLEPRQSISFLFNDRKLVAKSVNLLLSLRLTQISLSQASFELAQADFCGFNLSLLLPGGRFDLEECFLSLSKLAGLFKLIVSQLVTARLPHCRPRRQRFQRAACPFGVQSYSFPIAAAHFAGSRKFGLRSQGSIKLGARSFNMLAGGLQFNIKSLDRGLQLPQFKQVLLLLLTQPTLALFSDRLLAS